jgi:hypothetical protein
MIGSQRSKKKIEMVRESISPLRNDDQDVTQFLNRSANKQGSYSSVVPERKVLPFLVRPVIEKNE